MRYSERQLEDIDDRILTISMAAESIKDELRKNHYAADKEYAFGYELDLIVSEAIKLEMDLR